MVKAAFAKTSPIAFMRGLTFPGGQQPVIRGEGLYLRYPRVADFPIWAKLRAESQEFLTPWEPVWADDELTRGAFRRRIKRYQKETRQDSAYVFFVLRESDNALVGGCTISNVRRGATQCCTLGYWIGAPHARKGYMTSAVRLMCDFAFRHLGLHRVEAACLPHNTASIGLLRKCDFELEGLARGYLKIAGEWRDHLLFARLSD